MKMYHLKNTLILIIVCFMKFCVHGEVFSSISRMEDLVPTYGEVLELYETYLKKQEESLVQIKKMVGLFKSEYRIASRNPEEYVSNPIDSFRIIKQLYRDWSEIIVLMKTASTEFENDFINLKTTWSFPSEQDIVGAADAMLRLQHIYHLKAKDVSKGLLSGVMCSNPLSSNDCFELGMEIYYLKKYPQAQEWFTLANEMFKPEEFINQNKSSILEFLAYNLHNLGNTKLALEKLLELGESDPDFHRVQSYITKLQNIINNNSTVIPDLTDSFEYEDSTEYKELCREDTVVPPSIKKRLSCRYVSTHQPFSKLAPFKLEEYYLEPYIVVFHDVMYDEEIQYFKDEIKPQLDRALVEDDNEGPVSSKYRTSMNAWLSNDYSPTVIRVNNRIQDMTGLIVKFSEEPQIANYGIGGHYSEHFDFSQRDERTQFGDEDTTGNRLATVLIYMTDVKRGGNTVFPKLGISVRPVKGSAVFWYNLRPSGMGNTGTSHAACPVLIGSKWVLNKWIRMGGNEFITPCNLEFQDEGNCTNYPKAVRRKHL